MLVPDKKKTERTHILNRIGEEEILQFAQKIWRDQNQAATEIASEALNVIRETYQKNPTFFSGKSAKGIVGGLFYLLGQRHGSIRTQREISLDLNTTEITIRASCREWAKPFENWSAHRKTK
jgi:transcription initiation factor TFIIIB Brf1 subunit/transcription initiation factor TFIIB